MAIFPVTEQDAFYREDKNIVSIVTVKVRRYRLFI